jgi:hypothetical protein
MDKFKKMHTFILCVNIEEVDNHKFIYNSEYFRDDGSGNVIDTPQDILEEMEFGLAKMQSLKKLKGKNQNYLLKICEIFNRNQLRRAYLQLSRWEQRQNKYKNSKKAQNAIRYLNEVIVRYINWYEDNGLVDILPDPKKKVWKGGSRSDFAREVRREYQSNSAQYENEKDCSDKLFNEYEFPEEWRWTPGKCYGLVRRVWPKPD